jgi:hypothetical protein
MLSKSTSVPSNYSNFEEVYFSLDPKIWPNFKHYKGGSTHDFSTGKIYKWVYAICNQYWGIQEGWAPR